VEPVKQFVADLATNVLATSEVDLDGRRPQIRQRETNLGNLTADSHAVAGSAVGAGFGVDTPAVALQNGGGIRNNSLIPAGPITELNTFEILAFTNFVSVMEDITGEHLKDLLETSISGLPGENGRFGHWAGLSFEYDVTLQGRVIDSTTCEVSAEGDRVRTITVGSETIYPAARGRSTPRRGPSPWRRTTSRTGVVTATTSAGSRSPRSGSCTSRRWRTI
jgi:2',3'-cyclic-nucleotide 2'-phosphodiesterase (5'-nucleotidase family)